MKLALKDAGREPEEVDYVNLHGTSTVLNDRIETRAIKHCFKERAAGIPMSSTKSMVGHPQGASGASGISAILFAMKEGLIPPTLNLENPDPECDLDYVPRVPRKLRACSTTARISLIPACTAESPTNSAFAPWATKRASVVFPVPGGPHKIIE